MTLHELLAQASGQFEEAGLFFGHGTDNAYDDALMLALFALELGYDCDPGILDQDLSAADAAKINALVQQRIETRQPAAYLTRQMWFAGLSFYVDDRVLVPRSPIAELIVNRFEPWLPGGKINSILDLCTGSGCIALACAHYFPEAQVDASDLSEQALEVARINVERHEMQDRVHLYRSNLFRDLPSKQYNLIVSNPPYVGDEEMDDLPDEYRQEPELGLASGHDGLDAVREMLMQAAKYLTEDGVLVCEVGYSQAALVNAFPQVPFLWLEFEYGGEGVFLLTRQQLEACF